MPSIPELEEIRRKQILQAALRTISESGSANVTMEEIARAAGLSKGGLAHYFKSKRDLFIATFRAFFDQVFARVRRELPQVEGPMEKLLGFKMLYDIDDPDVPVGYPLLFDCMGLAAREEAYRIIFDEWVDNWVNLLREILEEGIDRGWFAEMDTESTARSISAIYQGIASRWFLARESHPTEWALASLERSVRGLLAPYLRTGSN